MSDGQMEKIYWLIMNFPDNFLTSCTSIEQGNLPSSSIGKMLYQHRESDIPKAHILCVSYWIMGEGQMEKIYWLIMNFPDKLLTSCTSIEQGNPPSSTIGSIYYINTGIVTFLTHILCDPSLIMSDRQMEKIYWPVMNCPDNLLTSCTSIEQGNLPSSSIGNIYYITTGIVTFETHILCVSSWIMVEGQKEKIYWLVMNFPNKLLTSCTSIEQGNIHSSSSGNIYYINTEIVTFLKHILCFSSWIMGEGQIKKIYCFLMNFPNNLLTSCTSIEHVYLPSSHIGKMLYQHLDSEVPNTQIMFLLLNHGWGTDGKDLFTCYELSW
jgi:hypothetical protein